MAFSFGSATTSAGGGFSFGAPAAKTTATASPFSFGAPAAASAASTSAPAATGSLFSFGAATATTTAAPSLGGAFSFGATTSAAPAAGGGFSLGGVAAKPAASSAAPVFGGFGAVAATTTASTGLFGAATASAATTTAASTGFTLGGGIKLGTASSAATTAATAPFSFGSAPAASSTAPTSLSTGLTLGKPSAASTAVSAASTFSFGSSATASSTAATPLKLGSAAVTTAATGFSLSTSAAPSAPATSAGTGLGLLSSASTTATTTTKQMSYKELEDTIGKWLTDLDEQEKVFLRQANQVNEWDSQLIANGEKIAALHDEVARVKAEQSRLDRELDFVLSQQTELQELITPIEEQLKNQQDMAGVHGGQHADVEREKTYKMAASIDGQLKNMMQDLRDIIEHINQSNASAAANSSGDDSMAQIARILNSHMDSLQWVDQNTASLQRRVDDVSRLVEVQKNQERSIHYEIDR